MYPILRWTLTTDPVIKTVEAPVTLSDPNITVFQEENAVVAADSYSLYKQLMEVKNQLTSSNNTMKEPPAVSSLKAALSLLYDSLVDGVFGGFFPHVERQRREATDEKRAYLDMAVTAVGAVMGKQNCSKMIACTQQAPMTPLLRKYNLMIRFFVSD